MTTPWQILVDDKEVGPFTADQIRELAQAGRIHPKDRVRKGGHEKSVSARKVQGLFDSDLETNRPTVPPPRIITKPRIKTQSASNSIDTIIVLMCVAAMLSAGLAIALFAMKEITGVAGWLAWFSMPVVFAAMAGALIRRHSLSLHFISFLFVFVAFSFWFVDQARTDLMTLKLATNQWDNGERQEAVKGYETLVSFGHLTSRHNRVTAYTRLVDHYATSDTATAEKYAAKSISQNLKIEPATTSAINLLATIRSELNRPKELVEPNEPTDEESGELKQGEVYVNRNPPGDKILVEVDENITHFKVKFPDGYPVTCTDFEWSLNELAFTLVSDDKKWWIRPQYLAYDEQNVLLTQGKVDFPGKYDSSYEKQLLIGKMKAGIRFSIDETIDLSRIVIRVNLFPYPAPPRSSDRR